MSWARRDAVEDLVAVTAYPDTLKNLAGLHDFGFPLMETQSAKKSIHQSLHGFMGNVGADRMSLKLCEFA